MEEWPGIVLMSFVTEWRTESGSSPRARIWWVRACSTAGFLQHLTAVTSTLSCQRGGGYCQHPEAFRGRPPHPGQPLSSLLQSSQNIKLESAQGWQLKKSDIDCFCAWKWQWCVVENNNLMMIFSGLVRSVLSTDGLLLLLLLPVLLLHVLWKV